MKRTEVTISMVNGRNFTVPGYEFKAEGIPLVVHRISPELGWEETTPKGWSVTEPLSGHALGKSIHATRQGACMDADNVVRKFGAASVLQAIHKATA